VKVLVIQTAFLGDVILTLPLIQVLNEKLPDADIDVVLTPTAAPLMEGHPSIRSVIRYDKKGSERGWRALVRHVSRIRATRYDVAVVPHRSLRSALLAYLASIPVRVGFDQGAAPWLMTKRVPYQRSAHEADRNLALVRGLEIEPPPKPRPLLRPSSADEARVESFLRSSELVGRRLVAVAPGSVWFTKRWPEERYSALVKMIEDAGMSAVMIGGEGDEDVCMNILIRSGASHSASAAGKFGLLASAALIARCRALVTNDSAPQHIGVAVGTPVVAIFGATAPVYGFAPYGEKDRVLETTGLPCRPCAVHGGPTCPIGTFECMLKISPDRVMEAVVGVAR